MLMLIIDDEQDARSYLSTVLRQVVPDAELMQIIGTTLTMSFFSTSISCILGMPLGVLLGYAGGSLVGMAVDGSDTAKNVSLIGQVADSMEEGKTSLIALVSEQDSLSFDVNFTKFDAHITRLDAAEVAAEVEKAMEVQRSLQKEAREKMREDKKEARRTKVEQQRARLEAEFEEFKQNFRRKDKE